MGAVLVERGKGTAQNNEDLRNKNIMVGTTSNALVSHPYQGCVLLLN